jgi:hypothetical protein
VRLAAVLVVIAPLATAPLARLTGLAIGGALLLPAFAFAVRAATQIADPRRARD